MNAVVCAIQDTAPHLRRISLKHELLKEVGLLAPGTHFKVFISPNKATQAVLPDMSAGRPFWPDEKTKPYIRTYTVRSIDRITGILDVEFVLHGDNGPASTWAGKAAIGDHLGIGIKRSGKIHDPADWYLFAGDETAIPAIAAILETLPAETTGLALLEVKSKADTFSIKTESAVDIRWLIRNEMPPEQSELLLHAVKNLVLPNPALKSRYALIAGEDNMVRAMRKYAGEQLGLNREELHATVYWKAGLTEDDYHQIRVRE
jgi:NADPH-dependent ferric siderophore reductase